MYLDTGYQLPVHVQKYGVKPLLICTLKTADWARDEACHMTSNVTTSFDRHMKRHR